MVSVIIYELGAIELQHTLVFVTSAQILAKFGMQM